ncbi:hypothetical protein GQR60_04185 [Labilibaculum sp. A4]|uniref:hypothetical protein n=1 Tax=Labilibaculum euxinus TaxID=2686357 RepID=UPI000F622726|nr:hypothetical protein [Labilibaculum euxinus]MDQ1772040.1 hypothetical protein [Labilibaculum euxinus]MWN75535.1 hypothetical protein [Labilibaculum euxinus]
MKSIFKLITCSVIVLFFSNSSFTQELNRKGIQSFFKDVISNPDSYHNTPSDFSTNKLEILNDLEVYRIDSIDAVRKYAYLIANNLIKNDTNSILKQDVVNFLLKGFNDSNSGICGIVSDLLKDYAKKCYDNKARNKILELLYLPPPYYHELIRLAGYVNPDSTLKSITELLLSGIIKSNEPYWAAKLALARIGDHAAMEFCMKQIKMMEVNDDLVYDYVPDLIYTHQREAFDFLIGLLNSNEKNCESSNAESTEMIVCGYRIMEYLAPVIKDFPLKISDSGDIDTNDYTEALQICRDWFLQHSDYKIINEEY